MSEDRIEAVLKRVRAWPRARQGDAARILLAMEAEDPSVYRLSDDERADLEAALDEVARGEIATDAEVARTFARLRGESALRRTELWVPDTSDPAFVAEAHRQSLAIARSAHEGDDQAFINAISAPVEE